MYRTIQSNPRYRSRSRREGRPGQTGLGRVGPGLAEVYTRPGRARPNRPAHRLAHRREELHPHNGVDEKLQEQEGPNVTEAGKRQQQGVEELGHRFQPPNEPQHAAYPEGADDGRDRAVAHPRHPQHQQTQVRANDDEDVEAIPRVDEVGSSEG